MMELPPYFPRIKPGDSVVPPSYPYKVDAVSVAVCPIDLVRKKSGIKRSATCFFWRENERIFLVTCWHCLTGIDPFTGKCIDSDCFSPDTIQFRAAMLEKKGDKVEFYRENFELALFSEADQPIWLSHKKFSEWRCDIALIDVTSVVPANIICISDTRGSTQIAAVAGSDVAIVGFPFEARDTIEFAIWKSGSFAQEPFVMWEGRPAFLIDAATRRGMSGAPVFIRTPNIYAEHSTVKNLIVPAIRNREFIGIYAGHLGNAALSEVTLGIAWYGSLVSEIASDPRPGVLSI